MIEGTAEICIYITWRHMLAYTYLNSYLIQDFHI